MKRSWPLLALGVGAFLIFALVTFPASIVLSRLDSVGVSAAGVSGTIWNGKAQVLQVKGVSVGGVEWQLHPLALFTLHANADVKVTRSDGFASTGFRVGPTGTMTFDELSASLPLSALPANTIPRGWDATINGRFTRLTLEKGWPTQVEGTLDAVDVTGPPRKPANVGTYRLTFAPAAAKGDTIEGTIADAGNGPLQISGKVQLKSDRSYAIDALVATKPDTPANLTKTLEFLGPPDAQGRRQFSMAGTL